jgi:hypothetical protein
MPRTPDALSIAPALQTSQIRRIDPILPDNGMVERFNRRIDEVLQSHHVR